MVRQAGPVISEAACQVVQRMASTSMKASAICCWTAGMIRWVFRHLFAFRLAYDAAMRKRALCETELNRRTARTAPWSRSALDQLCFVVCAQSAFDCSCEHETSP